MEENKVITLINPSSPYVEAYKKLQLNIQYASVDRKIKVIQITSAQASEGKTMTGINLAAVYALKKKKVLIIDMDFRKPRLHKLFNLHNENGLVDILADEVAFENAVYHHESGIDVLVRGSKTPSIELALESEKLEKVINELRDQYDVIIIDCPPTIAVTDSSLIARLADGLVFVIASNNAKKDVIRESIKRLRTAGANIIGTVMTQVSRSMSAPHYGNDHKYYQYYEYRGEE